MSTITPETPEISCQVIAWEIVVNRLELTRLSEGERTKHRRFYDAQVLIVQGYIPRACKIIDELDRNGSFNGRGKRIIELVRGKNR